MSAQELKSAIEKELENVPENVLEEVLDYLKAAHDKPFSRIKEHFKKIVNENDELLKRLAE